MRWLIATAIVASAALARAQDPEAEGGTDVSYDHRGQFGLHVQLGTGYRVLFPYEEMPRVYCGQSEDDGDPRKVCTGRSPFFVELGLSYGITSGLEVIADMRFGLETDFRRPTGGDAPRALVLAPGIKVYIDDEGSTKFFSTLQAAFDFTSFDSAFAGTSDTSGTDIGVRNVNGVLIDLHRAFGVYFHFGETIGFARWLRFEMDAGLGIQGRYP